MCAHHLWRPEFLRFVASSEHIQIRHYSHILYAQMRGGKLCYISICLYYTSVEMFAAECVDDGVPGVPQQPHRIQVNINAIIIAYYIIFVYIVYEFECVCARAFRVWSVVKHSCVDHAGAGTLTRAWTNCYDAYILL